MCERCNDDTAELFDRRLWLKRVSAAAALTTFGSAAGGLILPDGAEAAKKPKLKPPRIITRKEWGADETLRVGEPYGWAPVRKLVVHHTAGPNSMKDVKASMRIGYRYHLTRKGFSDIGYNFLIAPDGTVFEGRYSRPYRKGEIVAGEDGQKNGVVGGHTKFRNACTCGIALMGNYDIKKPPKAMIESLVQMLAWKSQRHQIDALRRDVYVSRRGERLVFYNVVGHKGLAATACPGRYVVSQMNSIRSQVAERAGRFPARTSDARKLAWMPNGD